MPRLKAAGFWENGEKPAAGGDGPLPGAGAGRSGGFESWRTWEEVPPTSEPTTRPLALLQLRMK